MIPQKQLPLRTSFILAFWKNFWVSRKVLILTASACSAKQVICSSIFLLVQMHHTILEQFTFHLEKVVQADLLLICKQSRNTWTYQVLCALQDFPASQPQFLDATRSRESINLKQFELPLHERIIGSWREPTVWHHIWLTIPAELWGLITRNLVYRWGLLLAGGVTEKEIISLCYLSTFAWIFLTISAVHFLAFAFLAITLWSKECRVITVI